MTHVADAEPVYYTVRATPLGTVLAAGSKHGIRYLSLQDTLNNPEGILQREFPSSPVINAHRAAIPDVIKQLETAIEIASTGHTTTGAPLLHLQGSPFQRSVWQYLQSIPPGETRSYQAVAEAIGRPRANRAVAQACAANRIAVLIPCHRVVCSDGSLSGYHWGIERKRWLLQRESVFKDKKKQPPS
jgi:AraC family transcriptional regulator of adaptative response/methylated-DNA-[protein]-cysteine methyltransferase